MLVVMKPQASPEEIQAVCNTLSRLGIRAHPLPGAQRTAIGITGNEGEMDRGNLEDLQGVAEVIRVSKPYKLVSRDSKEEDTVIRFPGTDATIGGREPGDHRRPMRCRIARAGICHSRSSGAIRAHSSSAAAHSSRGPRPMPSRGWGRTR